MVRVPPRSGCVAVASARQAVKIAAASVRAARTAIGRGRARVGVIASTLTVTSAFAASVNAPATDPVSASIASAIVPASAFAATHLAPVQGAIASTIVPTSGFYAAAYGPVSGALASTVTPTTAFAAEVQGVDASIASTVAPESAFTASALGLVVGQVASTVTPQSAFSAAFNVRVGGAIVSTVLPVTAFAATSAASDTTVANSAQLAAAITAAQPGDTILLAQGDYSYIDIFGRAFASEVVIASADPANPARVAGLRVGNGSSWLTFRDLDIALHYDTGFSVVFGGVSHMRLERCDVHGAGRSTQGGVGVFDSTDVKVIDCEIHDCIGGLGHRGCTDLLIQGNAFHDHQSDVMTGSGATRLTVRANTATDVYLASGHIDLCQLNTTGGVASRDILIEGNVYVRGSGHAIQGLFIGNETRVPYLGLTIRNNVLYGAQYHGISVDTATGAVVSGNVVQGYSDMGSWLGMWRCTDSTATDNCATVFNFYSNTNVVQTGSTTLAALSPPGPTLAQYLAEHGMPAIPSAAPPEAPPHLPPIARIAGWGERYWRDFAASGVISLNAAQTDAGLSADKGEYKAGTLRYREGGQSGGTYSVGGIPGYGFDACLDQFWPSLSAEYRMARPLGEIEPVPGVGVRLHARPNTGADNKAELEAIPYGQKAYADDAYPTPIELWSSGHLASWPNLGASPPFARYCAFILRNTYADHCFGAPVWSVEAGNHAYDGAGADTQHSPFEYDDVEQLGFGSGGEALSVSIHAFDDRDGSSATVLDARRGDYDPASPLAGVLVEVVTVFDVDGVHTYHRRSADAGYVLTASTPRSDLSAGGEDAEYVQQHIGFIHNIAAGHPWLTGPGPTDRIGFPTQPLALDIVKVGLFAPATNTALTLPANEPPGEVVLTWAGGAVSEALTPGTVLGSLSIPAGVSSVTVIGYGDRVAVSGSNLVVGAAGLSHADQPVVRFHLQGAKANGAKSVGRLYEKTVTA